VRNFAVKLTTKSPKKRRREKTLLFYSFFEVSFPFLTFHHPSLCFLSFFLSFSAATKPEFFLLFARAKTERERLREAFEKAFFSIRFIYIRVYKGKKTLEIFL